jgi:hypothetical protein
LKYIYIGYGKYVKTILYAQVVPPTSKDKLQVLIYKLNKIAERYNCKISGKKTKVMAFKETTPVR